MESNIIDKFSSIPNAGFKDITDNSSVQSASSDVEKEIMLSGDHTENASPNNSSSLEDKLKTASQGKEKLTAGKIFEGETAVQLLNHFLPSLLVALCFALGYVFKKEHLELTAKESKILSIPVQACLDTIVIDFNNAWVNLSVVAGMIYGSKFLDRIPVGIEKVVKRTPQPARIVPIQKQSNETSQQNKDNVTTDFNTGERIKTTPIENVRMSSVNNGDSEQQEEKFTLKEEELIDETRKRRQKGRAESIMWLRKKNKLPIEPAFHL
jgi:hypothetical protein